MVSSSERGMPFCGVMSFPGRRKDFEAPTSSGLSAGFTRRQRERKPLSLSDLPIKRGEMGVDERRGERTGLGGKGGGGNDVEKPLADDGRGLGVGEDVEDGVEELATGGLDDKDF
jgi:hypothetical protein